MDCPTGAPIITFRGTILPPDGPEQHRKPGTGRLTRYTCGFSDRNLPTSRNFNGAFLDTTCNRLMRAAGAGVAGVAGAGIAIVTKLMIWNAPAAGSGAARIDRAGNTVVTRQRRSGPAEPAAASIALRASIRIITGRSVRRWRIGTLACCWVAKARHVTRVCNRASQRVRARTDSVLAKVRSGADVLIVARAAIAYATAAQGRVAGFIRAKTAVVRTNLRLPGALPFRANISLRASVRIIATVLVKRVNTVFDPALFGALFIGAGVGVVTVLLCLALTLNGALVAAEFFSRRTAADPVLTDLAVGALHRNPCADAGLAGVIFRASVSIVAARSVCRGLDSTFEIRTADGIRAKISRGGTGLRGVTFASSNRHTEIAAKLLAGRTPAALAVLTRADRADNRSPPANAGAADIALGAGIAVVTSGIAACVLTSERCVATVVRTNLTVVTIQNRAGDTLSGGAVTLLRAVAKIPVVTIRIFDAGEGWGGAPGDALTIFTLGPLRVPAVAVIFTLLRTIQLSVPANLGLYPASLRTTISGQSVAVVAFFAGAHNSVAAAGRRPPGTLDRINGVLTAPADLAGIDRAFVQVVAIQRRTCGTAAIDTRLESVTKITVVAFNVAMTRRPHFFRLAFPRTTIP